MMKKLGILFATVVMIMIFAMSSSALHYGEYIFGDFICENYGDFVSISAILETADEVVTIPDEINGKKVTELDLNNNYDAEYINTSVSTLYIPESIEQVSISNVLNLEKVHLMGEFMLDEQAENIKVSGKKFKTITVDQENSTLCSIDGVLYSKDLKCLYEYPTAKPDAHFDVPLGVVHIYDSFYNNFIESIYLPITVKSVDWYFMSSCPNLVKISVDNLESWFEIQLFVDDYDSYCRQKYDLFIDDKILNDLIIPEGTTEIKGKSFYNCRSIETITIPESLKKISATSFAGTTWMENQTDDIVYLDKFALIIDSKSNTVAIKEGTEYISDFALVNGFDKKIDTIILPRGLKGIGKGAFLQCNDLKEIVIPETVEEIEDYALGYYSYHYAGTDTIYEKYEDFIIKGTLGSAAESYAIENDITFIPIEEHTHTYTSTVTKEATCWREGEKTYTCTCGESYTEAIAKLDHEYRPWETKKNPTCTAPGLEWSYCLLCDNDFEREIPATGHTIIDYTRRATPDSDGAYVTACDVCNEVFKSISFGRPTEYKLSTTKYTYDGKTKTPKLTVETSDGVVLKEGVDYELELPSGRKAVGVYTYRVVFKGNFLGEKKVSYQILPGKTSKITATQSTSAIKLTWKKVTGADGYRVYQYNSKTGKYEKIKTLTGTSYTVKKLKAGTTYKFAVKAYTKDNGETLWASSYKTITTATKPATPTVKATAGSKQATISWNKVTGATGYVVYMQDEFGDYEKLGSTKKTSYTRKKLTKGKTYYFRVRAYKTVDGKNIYGGYKTVKVKVK